MSLTSTDVLHLATLCRIELQPEEVDKYTTQISSILGYVDKLREVNVRSGDAVTNVTSIENVMRNDDLRACSAEERERILAQFPMREGDLLKTRGVFDE